MKTGSVDNGDVPADSGSKDELGPSESEEELNGSIGEAGTAAEAPPTTPTRSRTSSRECVLEDSSPQSIEFDGGDKALSVSGNVTPVREHEIDTDSRDEGNLETCPSWSTALQSPSEGEQFSPSVELKSPESLHGTGLLLAVDRAKKLSKCGRRCSTLFYDVAALYDTFAQAILKTSQALQSPMGGTPVAGMSNACIKSLISFSKQIQGLAICLRGSVARPLHGSMTSLGDAAPNVYKRYTSTRVKCFDARRAALQMRTKYIKGVREAERAITELKQAKGGEEESTAAVDAVQTDMPVTSTGGDASSEERHSKGWDKSLQKSGNADVVIRLLNQVQTLESQYRNLVEEENKAVSQSQTMELMALESLQELEEERLHFFVETIKRTLEAEMGALQKMVLSNDEDQMDIVDTISTEEKKGNVFTSFLKSASSQFDEGIGIMESETMGLPDEAGNLRDKVKSQLARRASRCQSMKSLINFFDEIATACATLAAGVTSRLGQEGYGSRKRINAPNGLLSVAMAKNEGPRVLHFWNSLVETIDECVSAARTLSEAFKAARVSALETLVAADKEMKAASEADDQRWKYLCEASRTETKAQSRYRQTSNQFEKARNRARSVDDGVDNYESSTAPPSQSGKGTTPVRKDSGMAQGMTKALGNVMSILPNGGEHAMKMMTPNARRKLAQKTLEEANEKEAKHKYDLEAATAVKNQALKSYTDTAEAMICEFKSNDEKGWALVRGSLELSVSKFEDFRQNRYKSLAAPSQVVGETANAAVTTDMLKWTDRVRKHVARKAHQASKELENGYKLKVELESSTDVYKLLALVQSGDDDKSQQEITGAKRSGRKESHSEPVSPSTRDLMSLSDTLKALVDADKNNSISLTPRFFAGAPSSAPETSKVTGTSKAETDVFLAHFWRENEEVPPTVIESFTCAYWTKEGEGFIAPLLHGRMFVTSLTMYFVGWGEKKIVLNWKDVIGVKKEATLAGTIDNAIRVSYRDTGTSGESSYFFGSFVYRDNAFELVDRLITIAKSLNEMTPKGDDAMENLPPVPPDDAMKKMEVVLSKKMKNVSVQKFYEVVWSDGMNCDGEKLYQPWLESMGSRSVNVTDWEFSEDGSNSIVNKWDGEEYSQKRIVNFEFTRTTHLYIGPPVAQVKQTQYCRVDGKDKVVLAMTVEMSGIPYADCFAVEVRWVARREGLQDLHVQVGIFVDFKKSTMFATKIRKGTIEESTPVHKNLFEFAQKKLSSAGEIEIPEAEETEEAAESVETSTPTKQPFKFSWEAALKRFASFGNNPMDAIFDLVILGLLIFFASFVFSGSGQSGKTGEIEQLGKRIDDLQGEIRDMHRTLEAILSLMKESSEK